MLHAFIKLKSIYNNANVRYYNKREVEAKVIILLGLATQNGFLHRECSIQKTWIKAEENRAISCNKIFKLLLCKPKCKIVNYGKSTNPVLLIQSAVVSRISTTRHGDIAYLF
jgi:hypothetical protein